jgi:hypothetical protein
VIAVDRGVLTDLCIGEADGFLFGDEDLDTVAPRPLVALQGQDVVGLLAENRVGDVPLAPSSGHSIRLRLTEPLASLVSLATVVERGSTITAAPA